MTRELRESTLHLFFLSLMTGTRVSMPAWKLSAIKAAFAIAEVGLNVSLLEPPELSSLLPPTLISWSSTKTSTRAYDI